MQILANGLISGLTIALLGVAFATVYWPTRVFFIAIAGVYAVTPFVAWSLLGFGLPWPIAMAAALATGTFLSIGSELTTHGPLNRRGASPGVHLISSLGMFIVLVQLAVLIWGSESQVLRTGASSVALPGGVSLALGQVVTLLVSLAALAVFFVWLRVTNIGLLFRALADNPTEVALKGFDVDRLRIVAFGVSGFFAAGTALLVAHDVGFDPNGGLSALLLAIVAVLIGGANSYRGTVVAGIILGVVRSEVAWFLSALWQDAVTFMLLAIILYVRPRGLDGVRVRLEADA